MASKEDWSKTYENYRSEQCQACGASRRPQGYYAPWLIERVGLSSDGNMVK